MTLSINDIEAMDRAALSAAWAEVFDTPVPKGLSRSFLRRFLAFEVQVRLYGGLSKGFLADLEKRIDGKSGKPDATLKPGGRLLREWNGTTHTIEVTDAGYHWNGQTHRSLSSVARAITGVRWSGPRFFGLKEDAR